MRKLGFVRNSMQMRLSGLTVQVLIVAFAFMGCETPQSVRSEVASRATASVAPLRPANEHIPNFNAFLGWEDKSEKSNPDPNTVKRIEIACADKTLYPTHPQSSLKLYHVALVGSYNHAKLSGTDEACLMPQKGKSSSGRQFCLAPDLLEFNVLSDTYTDTCGNMYRGFWSALFMRRYDNMGTLVSKGRTVYPKPKAEFAGEMIEGGTNPVDSKELLFVSPLFAGDSEQIAQNRAMALKAKFTFNPKTHLFIAR